MISAVPMIEDSIWADFQEVSEKPDAIGIAPSEAVAEDPEGIFCLAAAAG